MCSGDLGECIEYVKYEVFRKVNWIISLTSTTFLSLRHWNPQNEHILPLYVTKP